MTEQSAFYSPQFLRNFIELYRNHPCLWQIKNPNYGNKLMRKGAYEELVELTKSIVPDCDEDYIKKKIDSLRGSYRRETKKVNNSKGGGIIGEGIYTPKLWYYDLLTFVADQEESRGYPDSVPSPIQIYMRPPDHLDNESNEMTMDNTEDMMDSDAVVDPLPLQVFLSDGQKKRRLKGNQSDDSPSSKQVLNILNKAIHILDKKEDEFGLIGANVTVKLRRMSAEQAIYAETLIGQVLAGGLFGKLSEKTSLSYASIDGPSSSGRTSPPQQEGDSDDIKEEEDEDE
ncbi:hypothetical protein WDU94_006554 [Cyamophila willieti]